MPRTQTLCVLALWLLDAWLTPFPVAAQAIAGEPSPNAASPRNVWYWSSPVNVHWDNVIDEPYLIDKHPDWQRVDAKGNRSRVCNRPSADGSGYLEQIMIPKLEQQRLDAYKQNLADAIHRANDRCCYTSNWSWAISQRDPRTAPGFADSLSGDVGAGSSQDALYACRFASLMLSAQEHTPHDVMSAIYPKPIRTLPRMLQEGGLVMASGSSWFLWVNQLAPEQFAHLRTCYALVDARREALGRTQSLNPVAVLLSETAWERGLTSPEPGFFDSGTTRNLAFALQDVHYGVDVVNEQTLREQIGHWRMVVLGNQRQISPETLTVLKRYVAEGGTLVATDGSLYSGERDSPDTTELLGVVRTAWKDSGHQRMDINGQVVPIRVRWKAEPRGAEVLARLVERDEPLLTVRSLGRGRVAYLAPSSFPYPDEDGIVPWLMKKLGVGPMVDVAGEARDRHLAFSLRQRERRQLILHVSDLTTLSGGKRIEPNSSHEIAPVPPIPELVLRVPLGTKPTGVKVVPSTTHVQWQYQDDALRLVLRDFHLHAAVVLDSPVPEKLPLLALDTPFPPPRTYQADPVVVSENFDGTPLGKFPSKPVWAANTDAKTAIRIAADPASPTNRVLEFVGAPAGRPQPTWPSDQPRTKIDYVFFRPADGWRVVEQQVIDESVASDHRPLLVVLECVPSWLAFVPEMERMADLDGSLREHRWSEADGTKYAAELRRVQADWKTRAPIIQTLLTPERVRSLSKWAVKQMEAYATVPPLEKVQFQPVATDEKQGIILLESTVDTLPTHNPLVTRWLKTFVRYDTQRHAIVQVTITIRGQVLE